MKHARTPTETSIKCLFCFIKKTVKSTVLRHSHKWRMVLEAPCCLTTHSVSLQKLVNFAKHTDLFVQVTASGFSNCFNLKTELCLVVNRQLVLYLCFSNNNFNDDVGWCIWLLMKGRGLGMRCLTEVGSRWQWKRRWRRKIAVKM